MTFQIPTALRAMDVSRFAMRADQLRKFRPVISYWCEYFIVHKILTKGLHTTDDDCMAYTTTLMDRLEQTKEDIDQDAVRDDTAGKAYVEQFALETFARADKAVQVNKASAQTADTFRAAATFLDLVAIWGHLDPELAAKSKFAKYHALRITKALKAGEDPNVSDPVEEDQPSAEQLGPALEPDNPDFQRIRDNASIQPTVETAPSSSASSQQEFISSSTLTPPAEVVRAEFPPSVSPAVRSSSAGGGNFPPVPTFASENPTPNMPTASEQPMNHLPSAPSALDQSEYNLPSFYQLSLSSPTASSSTLSPEPRATQPAAHLSDNNMLHYANAGSVSYRTDDDAVMEAQKHAKWAISALDFEDVPTAVRELRIALHTLGA